MQKSLSRFWLLIGISALAVAGLFAVILVIARTPQLASLPLFSRLFHQSLVVHVDLSVLVWFLSIACLMWSRLGEGTKSFIPMAEEAALICFTIGATMIALSPLDPQGEAMMSNYIPVIHSPIFFLGLLLIGCGTGLMALKALTVPAMRSLADPLGFGAYSAALIAIMALAAFVQSPRGMPDVIDGVQYYELAFWGGGHVLQFTHTQMMMLAWLMLMNFFTQGEKKYLYALFSIGLFAALVTPLGYLHGVDSQEHRLFFTEIMIWLGGLAPLLLLFCMLPHIWRARTACKGPQRALWSSLVMSVILFVSGGVLGGMIEGQNVVIPAHYHGSIVGVTLAFMGLAYLLLPTFGYRDPAGWRLAYWQPIVYGVGQLLHMSGLAWSGGYGVLRKTPGALDAGMSAAKVTMGVMGAGGLLAVIGGLMFVIVAARSIWAKTN